MGVNNNKLVKIAYLAAIFGCLFAPLYAASDLGGSAEEDYPGLLEFQSEIILDRQNAEPAPQMTLASNKPAQEAEVSNPDPDTKTAAPSRIALDIPSGNIMQPIEIEEGKSILITGKNIRRFLVTEPAILSASKESADELLVTGTNIGYAFVHIWDDNDRWTLEFLGKPAKPEGLTYAEEFRRKEERARNFKLRYILNWSSYETGKALYKKDLKRQNFSFYHTLGIAGETPYGDLDTSGTYRMLNSHGRFTYGNLTLDKGKLGPFRDFKLQAGDYNLGFSNLALSDLALRGVDLYSPAFEKKFNYSIFWGRDNGGNQGDIVTDTSKASKNSFVSGVKFEYLPTDAQTYQFTVTHGWGRDREEYLNPYGYDLSADWDIGKGGLGYELAFDSESFANLLKARYNTSVLSLTGELRDVNQKFMSISGSGWNQGQVGSLFNLNYTPNDKFDVTSRLDIYKDRLYPAQEADDRLNEDFDWGVHYRPDSLTNMGMDYTLQNDLGKISQTRYQNPRLNLSRTFKLVRDVNTSFSYGYQYNQNFSTPSLNYVNNKINLGVRFSVIGALYYYFNRELNWLYDQYERQQARPNVTETGLDWSDQLGNSPFYGTLRFTYHDEERTESPLSFLSGEDYIEGYSELSFRSGENNEIYGNCRIRNTWAENQETLKRIEATFNAGMRYYWDTGLHWDSICDIQGYVFRDLNSDGLRQRDDPPIEGVKVWLGENKVQTTDLFGYFRFPGVRGSQATVGLDMNSIPHGFLATGPAVQTVSILQGQTVSAYFGIMSRSEISGFVFEDSDENGKFDTGEAGVGGVVISLEDGKKAKSDYSGRYSFPNAPTGNHTLTIDLNSVPVDYLPKVPLSKELELSEGVTYIYNIPMKKVPAQE